LSLPWRHEEKPIGIMIPFTDDDMIDVFSHNDGSMVISLIL